MIIYHEQLNLNVEENEAYGIIVDWNVGNGIVTITSFNPGEASMYLSSGGGVGGQHESVRNAVKTYLAKGQTFLGKATQTEENNLPNEYEVHFFLITKQGKFFGKDNMANMENGSSDWLTLFEEANNVLTELRLIE